MLEKTAASLEPCGLQRVLPGANKSFKSRRQLHTTFWQHGAADVELTSAWQVLMHGVFDSSLDTRPATSPTASIDPRHPALRASTFLLDFLYPTGSLKFLRRFSPGLSDRLDLNKSVSTFARVSPRLYSSSASASKSESAQADSGTQTVEQVSAAGETPESSNGRENHTQELERLLGLNDPEGADQLWHHYTSLDHNSKRQYIRRVIIFLSKTKRATDSWKISELFQQLEPSQWDSQTFLAGLEAELILQNNQPAQTIFEKGLENVNMGQSSLQDALDLILAAALKSSSRDLLWGTWKLYDKITARLDLDTIFRQLHRVRSLPRLGDVVLELRPYLRSARRALPGQPSLRKLLVRCAVLMCPDRQVLELLGMTNDPVAHDSFLTHSAYTPEKRKVLITQVYKIYRDLPQACPSHAALHTVFHAYKSMLRREDKLPGMEMLWADWLRFHQTPSRRAYQWYLAFYASMGDKRWVYKLWHEYIKTHGEHLIQDGGDTFAHLLQVHAVRQEASEAQRIFDEISTKFRLEPSRYCWCILLNAYAKAGDYEGAITTFRNLCDSLGSMDRVSVGTLMQMAADRGDLGFTLDLYRSARRQGVQTNDIAILGSLVEAYCQNDLFREAEDLCARAAMKGLKEPRLWNRIVHAFGLRRNLAGINKLLNRMTELEVPYNAYTYQELLMGLSLCKQSQHALHLLAVAVKDGAFEVNEGHFHTVMGAFIKTGEGDLAVEMHKLMQKSGFRESGDSLIALMTAFGQWSRLPHKRRQGHSEQTLLGTALRRFYKVYGIQRTAKGGPSHKSPAPSQPTTLGNLLQPSNAAFQFSRIVYLFTQMRDRAKVQELVRLYRYVAYGDADSTEPLPIQMLNSIMWSDVLDRNYDALQQSWNTAFALAKEGAVSAEWSAGFTNSKKISTRYRFILSEGVKAMQTMHIEQGDGLALQKLLVKVRRAGFEIDAKNWNLHVQGLIQCHLYKEAFDVCERWLMPNWTGWATARQRAPMKNAIPLDLRRKGTSPRHLRPVSHTLYHLAKGYIELDKMAPWSAETANMMARIKVDCPRCYRAISTMSRNASALEQQILGDHETPMPVDDEYDNQEYDVSADDAKYGDDLDGKPDGARGADEDDLSVPEAVTPIEKSL
ncbi:hypothetical protein BJ166DRAFT_528325 [Pestalotiopsis sp. NC0098]|nr:hypothetical protein BJ166DRAFT_528325 [Pestalotiopsis sp. NC0098]